MAAFKRKSQIQLIVAACLTLLIATPASATFHLWDFNEIYSNANGTIQFIEFTTADIGQGLLDGQKVISTLTPDGFTFDKNLIGSTAGKKFLIGTPGFAALGIVTPDYIMPANFFSITGDTLELVGGFFTPMTFSLNDLPINGVDSLNKNLSTGTNSPTNFADETGEITIATVEIFVEFGAGPGGLGTELFPFGTLQEAVDAAIAGANINIKSGTTIETFTAGNTITTELTLLNSTPEVDSVQIGVPDVRSQNPSGFRSRPRAARSTRSDAP